jgi:hypothetical protein
VLKVPFCLTYTLGDLLGVIREEAQHDDASHPCIRSFAEFVCGLVP